MPGMADRIGDIMAQISSLMEEEESWESIGNPRTDGVIESYKSDDLKRFAVGEYHLRHDISIFKSNLSHSASLYVNLFERNKGDIPTSDVVIEMDLDELLASAERERFTKQTNPPGYVLPSLLTMVTFKELFNALASGDLQLAQQLARLMGAHLDPEKSYDEPLDHYLGWALKYMVDDTPDTVRREWISRFATWAKTERPTLNGYALVMQAILDRDLLAAKEGFETLLKGHRREIRSGKLFADTVDEIICVWGVGLANLARWRGLPVAPKDELIPADLLV